MSTVIDRDTDCRYCGFPRHAHWGTRPIVAGRCPGFKAVEVKPAPTPAPDAPQTPDSEMLAMLVDLLKPGRVNGGVIEAGRDLLARLGHDVRGMPGDWSQPAPQTPDAPALMLAALKFTLDKMLTDAEARNYDPPADCEIIAEIEFAIAAAEGREG